jgi:flagellar motility protein MotE (MotC chaperone)
MKDALNPTCAAPDGSLAGRFARLVRGGAAACMLALLAVGAAHAQRQDHGPDRRDEARTQQDPRAVERPPEQAREQQRFDSRELDQRRQQMQQEQMRNAEARRGGRMTPDERRDLRRQINEAGMDLYPNTPRR